MKTFNKVIRGKDVKVKIFEGTNKKLENSINEWLSCNDVELVSVEFDIIGSCTRCFIMYKV